MQSPGSKALPAEAQQNRRTVHSSLLILHSSLEKRRRLDTNSMEYMFLGTAKTQYVPERK
jgi:hypothetical protein